MRMKIHDFANSKDVARELVELCPFGAFEYAGNKLSVNDSCRMCSVCMTKGPPGAITLTESENEQINKAAQ
jgi:electron transfer flavoprotein alpha subunit